MSGKKKKFSNQDIWLIRRLWDDGLINTIETAKFYGCGAETIRRIGRRETYGWLPPSQEELDHKLQTENLSPEVQHMLHESSQMLYKVSQDRILGNLTPLPLKEALRPDVDTSVLTAEDRMMLEQAVNLGADRTAVAAEMLKDSKYHKGEERPKRVIPPDPMEVGIDDPGEGQNL